MYLIVGWSLFGMAAYALFLRYALYDNLTNHTGGEPLLLLVIPVSLAVAAFFAKGRRYRIYFMVVCLTMVGISAWLDLTNGMLNYSRWIHKGMPGKWEW